MLRRESGEMKKPVFLLQSVFLLLVISFALIFAPGSAFAQSHQVARGAASKPGGCQTSQDAALRVGACISLSHGDRTSPDYFNPDAYVSYYEGSGVASCSLTIAFFQALSSGGGSLVGQVTQDCSSDAINDRHNVNYDFRAYSSSVCRGCTFFGRVTVTLLHPDGSSHVIDQDSPLMIDTW